MQATLTRAAAVLQRLFGHAPEVAAASAELIKQPRKLTPCAFARGLTFGWMQHPHATTAQLARSVAAAGADLSEPGLCQRFTAAASAFFLALLRCALQVVLAAPPAAAAVLGRFNGVYLFDGTQLTLPAVLAGLWANTGGATSPAGMKVLAVWELLGGALALELGPGRTAELGFDAARRDLPAGSLRLGDLGFFDLDLLKGYSLSGVYWVSRAQPMTVLGLAGGRRVPLWQHLQECREGRLEEWVEAGQEQGLPCRLLAWRCPQEVAARRLQKALSKASKRGQALSVKQRVLCHWTVLLTNVPPEKLSAEEAWVVYRVRWQVELLFKRWKSLGGLGQSRGEKPYRVLTEVYAKLLGAVLVHWLALLAGPCRRRSAWKAYRETQGWAKALMLALDEAALLKRLLGQLAEVLGGVAGVGRRRARPAAFQTLEQPGSNGPAVGPPDTEAPMPARRGRGRPRRTPKAPATP
jgi:hypothetical protein